MVDCCPKHLTDISHLECDFITKIINTAKSMRDGLFTQNEDKKTIALMFAENSTRTKLSFEKAALNLKMDVLHFDCETSSFSKGETLKDTAENLYQMGVDAIILRHSVSGILNNLTKNVNSPISFINAGDGSHAHPTQALLDYFTMLEKMQTVENKKIVIIGDIAHSRVARSNIALLQKFGANICVCAPSYFEMPFAQSLKITTYQRIEEALENAQVVMCLRVQNERLEQNTYPVITDYIKGFQITSERLTKYCDKNVILMHPGPVNIGVEISKELMNSSKGKTILEQVKNGVYVRMAILHLLLNAEQKICGGEIK